MKRIIFIIIPLLLLNACADQTTILPGPSGRAGEVLIIMNDKYWDAESGKSLFNALAQDMPGLAWSEPMFDISHLTHASFIDMVRIARNIVEVDVGNKYSSAKIKFFKNRFSKTQAYAKIQAPDEASLAQLIKDNEATLLNFFKIAERERLTTYFKKNKNDEYQKKVNELIGYDVIIPSNFNHHNFTKDNFVWLSGGNTQARIDLAMYTFPCKDESLITTPYLIKMRDSIMKINIPGPSEGSYVRTADVVTPELIKINKKMFSIYELKGLWETTVDFMGGPFISYAYYDNINKQVKVLEGFIYAPHEDKRNLIRRVEAVANTWNPTKTKEDLVKPKVSTPN
jgi:hypothetical protein